jgi:hypothetical protein
MGICMPPAAADSSHSYRVKQLEVYVMVGTNGDILVAERITFNLTQGNFSMIYRQIPHFGYERLADATVFNGSGEPVKSGTAYQFDWFRGKYELRWTFNPIIGPAEVNYTIMYGVTNVIAQTSKDQNGLDWYAVGEGWEVTIETLNFTMVLPANYSGSPLLRVSPGNVEKQFTFSSTLLYLNKTNIPPKTPVRVTVHFPKSVDPRFSWERALRENTFVLAGIIFAIVFIIFLAVALTRFVASRLPPKDVRADRRLHAHPSKLATLVAGKYTPYSFLAGAVALAKRGGLRLLHDSETDDVRLEVMEMEEAVGSHDALLLSSAKEEGSVRAIGAHWPGFKKELQRHCKIELKFDGMVTGPGRLGVVSIVAGIVMLIVSLTILLSLLYLLNDTWDAVLYGGILLGVALAGTSTLVIGGFLTPRTTLRGARERASQLAYADGLRTRILELASTKPAEAAAALNQYLPLLIAASPAWRGGFPELLRQVASAAPDAPFNAPWYVGPAGTSPGTLGEFGRDFAHTADEVPRLLGGPAAMAGPAAGAPPEPDSGLYSEITEDIPELKMETEEQSPARAPPIIPPPDEPRAQPPPRAPPPGKPKAPPGAQPSRSPRTMPYSPAPKQQPPARPPAGRQASPQRPPGGPTGYAPPGSAGAPRPAAPPQRPPQSQSPKAQTTVRKEEGKRGP